MVIMIACLSANRYFTSEEIKGCVLTAPVGNVNADTEFFYGYGFSSKPKQEASPTKSVYILS